MASLLNKTKFAVNSKISVHIPTIREIRGKSFYENGTDDDEKAYYSLINLFVATPSSMMVELDKAGIDFTKISEYDLFFLLFKVMIAENRNTEILNKVMPLLFDNISLINFKPEINTQNGQNILYDNITDTVIDELIYMQLSTIFCTMHFMKKLRRKPANETAKRYIIERTEKKEKALLKSSDSSVLENTIIAMVNNRDFKYNFETVQDLTIYDFNVSAKQIIKKCQVDNLTMGAYFGTVDIEKIDDEKLNWLSWK